MADHLYLEIYPPPCDECALAPRCATERLACTEYRAYLSHGGRRGYAHLVLPVEAPTSAMYSAIYADYLGGDATD